MTTDAPRPRPFEKKKSYALPRWHLPLKALRALPCNPLASAWVEHSFDFADCWAVAASARAVVVTRAAALISRPAQAAASKGEGFMDSSFPQQAHGPGQVPPGRGTLLCLKALFFPMFFNLFGFFIV